MNVSGGTLYAMYIVLKYFGYHEMDEKVIRFVRSLITKFTDFALRYTV